MATALFPHIELDDRGVARFTGTRFKIIHVIIEHTHWKWSPEAIQLQHPDLTLGQIHSALAYYFDHQADFDAEIRRQAEDAERLWKENLDSPGRRRLRRMGLLPDTTHQLT
jgi:uncharacterized protein (DUF433 family)